MQLPANNLLIYDGARRRLWIAGQRCHHGATGALLFKLLTKSGVVTPDQGRALSGALWARQYRRRDAILLDAGIRLTNVFNFQPPSNRIDALVSHACLTRHFAVVRMHRSKLDNLEFAILHSRALLNMKKIMTWATNHLR